jgi:hypothetical protein
MVAKRRLERGVAIDFAPMRTLAAVVRRVALAEAVVLVCGVFTASAVATLEAGQFRMLALGAAACWVLECLVVALAIGVQARPLARALDAPPPIDPELASRAASAAIGLPGSAATALLLAGILGTVLTVLGMFLGRRLPFDLALAATGVGIGITLLGAMVGHAVCAGAMPLLVGRLGLSAEAGVRGTMRGKILLLAFGLNAIAVLLVASTGYIRHRESVWNDLVVTATRVADANGAQLAGRSAADVALAIAHDAGSPAAVLSPSGRVLASSGHVPELPPG